MDLKVSIEGKSSFRINDAPVRRNTSTFIGDGTQELAGIND